MADNLAITPGSGATIATRDTGTAHLQRVIIEPSNRSDTYTVAANGTTVDVSTRPCSKFGIQLKGTGAAATAWSVPLEVSLDGTNFQTLVTHATADGDGAIKWLGSPLSPALYFRSRCASITLGAATNVVVTIVGMP